jgi:hypothetical protein
VVAEGGLCTPNLNEGHLQPDQGPLSTDELPTQDTSEGSLGPPRSVARFDLIGDRLRRGWGAVRDWPQRSRLHSESRPWQVTELGFR